MYGFGQVLTYRHFLTRKPVTGTYDSTHPMTGELRIEGRDRTYTYVKPADIIPEPDHRMSPTTNSR